MLTKGNTSFGDAASDIVMGNSKKALTDLVSGGVKVGAKKIRGKAYKKIGSKLGKREAKSLALGFGESFLV